MTKSSQKAGDNSKQIIVDGDLNINSSTGVTVSDVNELILLHVDKLRAEFTLEAKSVAQAKIESFETKLIKKLSSQDLLESLRNAGYQQNIFDASRAVASSDNDDSEDFLIGLLIERAKDNSSQSVKIAISKAIQIADKLESTSLNGLTAEWSIMYLTSNIFNFDVEWQAFKSFQEPYVKEGLPKGKRWQDDLDALDLIRVEPAIIGRTSYIEAAQRRFAAYLIMGISENDIKHSQAEIDGLKPEAKSLIIPHPLKEKHMMLNAKSLEDFNTKLSLLGITLNDNPTLEKLVQINGFGATDGEAVGGLSKRVESDKVLSEYSTWWDSLSADRFTGSGQVIGFLNAKRYIPFNDEGVSGLFKDR